MTAWVPEQVPLTRPDTDVRLPDLDALLALINEGAYDDHLEDILAAAHGRKRARRGLRHPYGWPHD